MERREEMLAEAYRPLYRQARESGMSEEGAFQFAVGRDGAAATITDPFDEMVETFRSIGLSEEGARQAAIGHSRSESEARESMAEVLPDLQGIGAEVDAILEAQPSLAPHVAVSKALAARYVAQGASAVRAPRLAAEAILGGRVPELVKAADVVAENRRPARRVGPRPVVSKRQAPKTPARRRARLMTHQELVVEAVAGGLTFGEAEQRIAGFARARHLSIAEAVEALSSTGIAAGTGRG